MGPQTKTAVLGSGSNRIRMGARPTGEAAHLGQSPTIEDSKVQDFIELIQMGLQGTAPAHHTLAHPKCPSDLAVHKLLCKPARPRLSGGEGMQYDKDNVLHRQGPFFASLQGQDCWVRMHDAKASLLHWSDTRSMLTPCAYKRLLNELTNLHKLQAVDDMQPGMAVEQVMTDDQPARQPAIRQVSDQADRHSLCVHYMPSASASFAG